MYKKEFLNVQWFPVVSAWQVDSAKERVSVGFASRGVQVTTTVGKEPKAQCARQGAARLPSPALARRLAAVRGLGLHGLPRHAGLSRHALRHHEGAVVLGWRHHHGAKVAAGGVGVATLLAHVGRQCVALLLGLLRLLRHLHATRRHEVARLHCVLRRHLHATRRHEVARLRISILAWLTLHSWHLHARHHLWLLVLLLRLLLLRRLLRRGLDAWRGQGGCGRRGCGCGCCGNRGGGRRLQKFLVMLHMVRLQRDRAGGLAISQTQLLCGGCLCSLVLENLGP
mmetsp:Transcript_37286/g.93650  ORF Transcript_37286/g.93650 Transcript_37286/m.93650 type:complete len:283 (-) Transcript_37286:322-1170(-)